MSEFDELTTSRYVVKVRFPFGVEHFSELARLVTALRYIDTHTGDYLYNEWMPRRRLQRRMRAKIISFYIGSPPDISFLANPAWIALLVAILGQYRNIKSNLPEIREDVLEIVGKIKGFSQKQKRALADAAIRIIFTSMETAERQVQRGAEALEEAAREARRVTETMRRRRYELVGRNDDLPEIEIISLDDDEDV